MIVYEPAQHYGKTAGLLPFYTEGPCADDGELILTTLSGGQLRGCGGGGTPVKWAEASCSNGQLITTGGMHLVCDSSERAIVQFDHIGRRTGELL